jgi:transcriptional regulator with XRE-family HTH domain
MEFKDRLKQARLKKGLSQSELCKLLGIHVTNISRYERGENKPTTEVLTKIANALDITTDFLMDGSIDDKAKDAISDKELLSLFQRLAVLSNEKKSIIKEVIDAFLIKADLQSKFATH